MRKTPHLLAKSYESSFYKSNNIFDTELQNQFVSLEENEKYFRVFGYTKLGDHLSFFMHFEV